MRDRTLSIAMAVSLLCLTSACKKHSQPQGQENEQATSPSSNQLAPVGDQVPSSPTPASLLKVKWPVGNRYVYRMEMEQRTTNQVPGSTEPTREDLALGVTYALNVIEETSAGGREMELEFLANDLEIKMNGSTAIQFDSAATNQADHPVPPPFRRMIGSKMLLRLGSDGTVDKVLGYDAWVKSVAGDAAGPASQMLVQQFNEGFFRQVGDFGRGLPNKSVSPGERWPHQTEVPAGGLGKIRLESFIQLTGWEERDQRRLALLEAQGTLKSIPDPTTAGSPGALNLDQGVVKSRSWFDPEAGALVESVVEQTMRIQSQVPSAAGTNAAPTVFTSQLGQTVTLKLAELGRERR